MPPLFNGEEEGGALWARCRRLLTVWMKRGNKTHGSSNCKSRLWVWSHLIFKAETLKPKVLIQHHVPPDLQVFK